MNHRLILLFMLLFTVLAVLSAPVPAEANLTGPVQTVALEARAKKAKAVKAKPKPVKKTATKAAAGGVVGDLHARAKNIWKTRTLYIDPHRPGSRGLVEARYPSQEGQGPEPQHRPSETRPAKMQWADNRMPFQMKVKAVKAKPKPVKKTATKAAAGGVVGDFIHARAKKVKAVKAKPKPVKKTATKAAAGGVVGDFIHARAKKVKAVKAKPKPVKKTATKAAAGGVVRDFIHNT
ncbi:hypothetical protein B0H15DRAFT_804967 [Mycena belliarum]|uniref:Uncharacterized protein n=1 Tax=Mycena belliarum TaxID=1033014 RepID=A0AAD6TUD2_9AGAR|nr:hypothetical protein B0H15DRAFT_804967 [Mycena belliae]